MSTTAAPYGARPIGTVVGSPYQGKVTHYKIKNAYGTSIFYGDIVKLADDNPNTTILTKMTWARILLSCKQQVLQLLVIAKMQSMGVQQLLPLHYLSSSSILSMVLIVQLAILTLMY